VKDKAAKGTGEAPLVVKTKLIGERRGNPIGEREREEETRSEIYILRERRPDQSSRESERRPDRRNRKKEN
jgi:hypothetical protein